MTSMIITLALLEILSLVSFFIASCTDPGVLKIPVCDEEQESILMKITQIS